MLGRSYPPSRKMFSSTETKFLMQYLLSYENFFFPELCFLAKYDLIRMATAIISKGVMLSFFFDFVSPENALAFISGSRNSKVKNM